MKWSVPPVCGPMFGLLLSSVSGPPRAPTPHWVFRLGRARGHVRGQRAGQDPPPTRRVDNLRTEWLSIYLFLIPPLCSRGLAVGGNPGTPMDPDPALLPDRAGLQCPCGARQRPGLRWEPVGCRFKDLGGAAREKNPPPKVYETQAKKHPRLH